MASYSHLGTWEMIKAMSMNFCDVRYHPKLTLNLNLATIFQMPNYFTTHISFWNYLCSVVDSHSKTIWQPKSVLQMDEMPRDFRLKVVKKRLKGWKISHIAAAASEWEWRDPIMCEMYIPVVWEVHRGILLHTMEMPGSDEIGQWYI